MGTFSYIYLYMGGGEYRVNTPASQILSEWVCVGGLNDFINPAAWYTFSSMAVQR